MNDAESPEQFDARAKRWAEDEKGYYNSTPLTVEVKRWPTPTLDDVNNATRDSGSFQSLTRAAVNQPWPTPDASPEKYRLQGNPQQSKSLNGIHMGRLNAAWVAQIMGWPDGWITGLPPEVFGRLEEEKRSTRGKRRASSKSAPKATSKP